MRNLKAAFVMTILIACSVNVFGQQQANKEEQFVPPTEVLSLLSLARLAAPEIGIDTFIAVSRSEKSKDKNWRRDLLEEAYRMTGDLKNPVRKEFAVINSASVDTRAGYLAYAYDLQLDALTLRSRIIAEMLKVDPERARQMLSEINGRLNLEPLECSSGHVYDVSDIYKVVGAVSSKVFTKKEIEEGARAIFLSAWFENMDSPAQIAPALELLNSINSRPAERHLLFAAISKAMDKRFTDDRSFTYALGRGRLSHKIYPMITGIEDPAKASLKNAFRELVIKNLKAPRCSDNAINEGQELPYYLKDISWLFDAKPLTAEAVATAEKLGTFQPAHYWTTDTGKQMLLLVSGLRVNAEGEPVTEEDKAGDVWKTRVNDVLEKLNSWTSSDIESESDVFNQKCVMYGALLERIGEGPLRKDIFRAFIRFLDSSKLQRANFIEWYIYADRGRKMDKELFAELAAEVHNPNFRLMSERDVVQL